MQQLSQNEGLQEMQQVAIKTVGLEVIVNLLEESTTLEKVDTGSTLVTSLQHPQFGSLTVIQNCADDVGVLLASQEVSHLIPS